MSIKTGMFVYPWDIAEDFNGFQREYPKTGCSEIIVNASYHNGSLLNPRMGRIHRLPYGGVSFIPEKGLYGDIKPFVHEKTAESGILHKVKKWAGERGIGFHLWAVLLHNSDIGKKYRGSSMSDILGNENFHALCPANPEVEKYVLGLVADLSKQFQPDGLLIESATLQTAFHGSHHEISVLEISPALKWLMSFCFCPHCRKLAETEYGIDIERTMDVCKRLVGRLLNRETIYQDNRNSQITNILLEYPEIYAYQKFRESLVSGLIAKLSEILKKEQITFTLFPSSIPYEVNQVFMEGMNYRECSRQADIMMPLVYGEKETFRKVKNNIELFHQDKVRGMAVSARADRFADAGQFIGCVLDAAADGCENIYYYNYSLISEERLSWIRRANESLVQSGLFDGMKNGGNGHETK